MKLQKAIMLGEGYINRDHLKDFPDTKKAFRLLIEAGKRIQNIRGFSYEGGYTPLPGETKERTVQREGKDITGNYHYEERQA